MSAPKLRAADLVPGRLYIAPSGRVCRLVRMAAYGTALEFAYVNLGGDARTEECFQLHEANRSAIAAMREFPR